MKLIGSRNHYRIQPLALQHPLQAAVGLLNLQFVRDLPGARCGHISHCHELRLRRREGEGKEIATMGPVCTIMVGWLDDWLKVLMERNNISIDTGYLEWAGVAVFKKTYRLFRERGYRLRLLSAAFRNHMRDFASVLVAGSL